MRGDVVAGGLIRGLAGAGNGTKGADVAEASSCMKAEENGIEDCGWDGMNVQGIESGGSSWCEKLNGTA